MLTLLSVLLFLPDIHRLGSEDHLTRRAAHARLLRFRYLTWRLCEVMSHAATDREVKRKCKTVARYGTTLDHAPMIAFALRSHPLKRWSLQVEQGIPARVEVLGGYSWLLGPDSAGDGLYVVEDLRQRTRTVALTALWWGVPRGWVESLLRIMRQRESDWLKP